MFISKVKQLNEIIQVIKNIKLAVFNKMSANKPESAEKLKFKELATHISNIKSNVGSSSSFYTKEQEYDIIRRGEQYINNKNGEVLKQAKTEFYDSSGSSTYSIAPYVVLIDDVDRFDDIRVTGFIHAYPRRLDNLRGSYKIEVSDILSKKRKDVYRESHIKRDEDTSEIRLYFNDYSLKEDLEHEGDSVYVFDILTQGVIDDKLIKIHTILRSTQ